MYIDGEKVGEGRIEVTVPMGFMADEGMDIGKDATTSVTENYKTHFEFTGKLNEVDVELRPGELLKQLGLYN